jgi:hypothetical protein
MAMREAYTAIIAQGEDWTGTVATEPYEAPWALEAVVFLRLLDGTRAPANVPVSVQISPDGMNWCDEGTTLPLPEAPDQVTFAKVGHFGQYLRLAATLPAGATCTVLATLSLKG